MIKIAMLAVALLACTRADSTQPTPQPMPQPKDPGVARGPEVTVELAGVTLAGDCGEGQDTKQVPAPAARVEPAAAADRAMPAAESVAMGACADPGNCHGPTPPACEQTSMQLAVRSSQATQLVVKKVELLDKDGQVVGELAARGATRWDTSQYVAWDEAIAANTPLSVSYRLTSPDWNKIANGRWNAMGMQFKLRVTVTIADRDRTIEKQSISPALLEPEVAT